MIQSGEIIDDLRDLQPLQWAFWQAVEDETSAAGSSHNWGLIHADLEGESHAWSMTKKYYALANFSKFIRPGAKRIASSPSRSQLLSTAFVNTDGKVAVVVMNPTEKAASYWLWLNGDAAEVNSLPRSIQTLVF